MTRTLHLLAPHGPRDLDFLLAHDHLRPGDLVAELQRFPPLAHGVQADGTLLDVTIQVAPGHDPWRAARAWLVDFTAATALQELLALDLNGQRYGFWWTLNAMKFVPGLSNLSNTFAWIDLLHGLHQRQTTANAPVERLLLHNDPGDSHLAHLAREIFPHAPLTIEADATAAAPKLPPRRAGLLAARAVLGALGILLGTLRRPQVLLFTDTNYLRAAAAAGERQRDNARLADVYFGEVDEALRRRGWRTWLVEKYSWHASWRGLLSRGLFFPNDLLFLLAAPALFRFGFYRQTTQRWRRLWAQHEASFMPHMRYRGCDLSPLLRPLLRREFTQHAPNVEILVRLWRWILARWRPRVLVLTNGYGRSAQVAIMAAHALQIPTVEQQHGLIGRNHFAYRVPRELETTSIFPLAERMAVWGPHFARLLAEANIYPPQQVDVCGFPRIDALLHNLPDAKVARQKLDLPPGFLSDGPLVLYTSNALAAGHLEAILNGMAQNREARWLIKLHPREKTEAVWRAAIQARGLSHIQVISGTADFYALLAACDVHVSFASTTLIEAAILGKPNLGLDVPHVADPGGFAQAGAFWPVPPAQLGDAVHTLSTEAAQRETLLREQRAFANAWCVHDGRAVERLVAVVEGLAVSSRNPDGSHQPSTP